MKNVENVMLDKKKKHLNVSKSEWGERSSVTVKHYLGAVEEDLLSHLCDTNEIENEVNSVSYSFYTGPLLNKDSEGSQVFVSGGLWTATVTENETLGHYLKMAQRSIFSIQHWIYFVFVFSPFEL